jgi:hypothetical protein
VGVLENENGDWLVRFANLGLGTIARDSDKLIPCAMAPNRKTCHLSCRSKVLPIMPVAQWGSRGGCDTGLGLVAFWSLGAAHH